MKRYYLRYNIKSRSAALLIALFYTVAMLLFTVVIYLRTPAPWWTLLPVVLMIPIGIGLFFRRDTYYGIDSDAYLLVAGNDYGRRQHVVAYLTQLQEVVYLPHTKEVKITKGDGTDYLKMHKGEEFVQELEALFTQMYADKEGTKEE